MFRQKDLNSLDAARFVIVLYESLEDIPSNVIMFLNNVLEVEDLKGLLSDLLVVASESMKDAFDFRAKWAEILSNTLPGGELAKAIADARAAIENSVIAQVGSVRDALDNLDITLEGDFGENFAQIRDQLSDARDAIQGDIGTYSTILKSNIDNVRNDLATTTGSIRNRLEEVNSGLNLTLGDHGAILTNVKTNTASLMSRSDSLLNISSRIDGNLAGLEANIGTLDKGTVAEMVSEISGRLLNLQSKDRARDASDLYSDQNLGNILSGSIRSIEVPSILDNLPDGVVVDMLEGIIEIPENFVGDRIGVTITPPENLGARVENWVTGVSALDTPLNVDTPDWDGLSYRAEIDLPSASELKDAIESNLLILAGSEDSDVGGFKFTPTVNERPWKVTVRR
jgi:hypothetical protein